MMLRARPKPGPKPAIASGQIRVVTGTWPQYSMPTAGRVTLGQVLAALAGDTAEPAETPS